MDFVKITGKPLFKWMIWGEKYHYFRKHPHWKQPWNKLEEKKHMETHMQFKRKVTPILQIFHSEEKKFTCFWDSRVPFTTKKLAAFMDSDSKVRSPHPSFDVLHANHGHPQQPRCNWKVHCAVPSTLRKTNIAPENGVPQKESSVPRINFHVLGV